LTNQLKRAILGLVRLISFKIIEKHFASADQLPINPHEKEKRMTRYNQGWRENRQRRNRSELAEDLKTDAMLFVLAHICLFTMLGLFGCAGVSNSRLAVELPLEANPAPEVGMPASISLNIRVAQMGLDCKSQRRVLKEAFEQMLEGEGIEKPHIFQLEPFSGSSLCGFSQGVADMIANPQLGARHKAKARLTVYWSAITEGELRRAHTVLVERMRAK